VYLDLVRGFSALLVLFGHTMASIPNPPKFGTFYPVQSWAVVVFFVLSGFLICMSATSKQNYTFGGYLIDRFSRVYVALFPTLILIYIVDTLTGSTPINKDLWTFFGNATMLMGIPFDRMFESLPYFQPFGSGRPLWTVAVEWWMYVAFGYAFFARSIKGWSLVIGLLLLPIAFAVTFIYGARESLAIIWIVGALLAVPLIGMSKEAAAKVGAQLLILSLGLLLMRLAMLHPGASSINFYDGQLMLFTEFVIFSGLICFKGYRFLEKLAIWVKPFARWIADISYSLYLTHYTLLVAFKHYFGMSWMKFFIFCTIAILFSWLFTIVFDHQYRKFSRFLKSIFLKDTKKVMASSVDKKT